MKLKLLLYCIFYLGCSNPTVVEERKLEYVSFDINLQKNRSGYYLLPLDRGKNQTIHTIVGKISPPIAYKRFEWYSDKEFYIGPYLMSTTGIRSYTNNNGIFRNSIGPTLEMVGDTLRLEVKWDPTAELDDMYFYKPTESETFYIILE